MNLAHFSCLALLSLLAAPAAAQIYTIPPGAYRTAAAYHRRQPQPAGSDATYPDKRGNVVVVVPRGAKSVKLRIPPDSVWGYVSDKGRTSRIYRGQDYRVEYADTLSIYSQSFNAVNSPTGGASSTAPQYYFSRGLTGLLFPLTPRYLREAYQASNPAFAEAVGKLRIDRSLGDFDKKTGLFRVTTIYRESLK
ncbi:hypothetical protein [Hymenobacter negativus]|uniref:Uncharacterized protein n=1 Tax=Hymenobacter negativus TaxID=2795026 RepID=A0ABS3QE19_9BACT|nr:hypothetical protein [Hymenobacter negativus]MBO2009366.1 hypothetical protein [Hymenobacter negativus]